MVKQAGAVKHTPNTITSANLYCVLGHSVEAFCKFATDNHLVKIKILKVTTDEKWKYESSCVF